MFKYEIYGLKISSSHRMNILRETDFSHPDLIVSRHLSRRETVDNALNWTRVPTELLDLLSDVSVYEAETPDGKLTKVCFNLQNGLRLNFLIDANREKLEIFHQPEQSESDLESHFVGPVMSFVMRLRGLICLHASVAAIGDRAIAFAGHATAGKSTLAAGMANVGAQILADDIAVLARRGDEFYVQPGYEKVRLRPVAAEFLTDAPENLPAVYSFRQSRYFSLEEGKNFRREALPLAAIYILGAIADEYREPFIKPLETREKLMCLVQNTSGSYVVTGNSRGAELQALAQIAAVVPIRRLFYAHDIETLPQQCELILRDFERLAENTAETKSFSSGNSR